MENHIMNYNLNKLKVALLDPETEIISSTKTLGSKPQQIHILLDEKYKDANAELQKDIVVITVQKDMLSRNLDILLHNAKVTAKSDIIPFDLIDEPFRYGWEIALVIDENESKLTGAKKKVSIKHCSFVPEQWIDNLFINHMINMTMEEMIWLQTKTNFQNFNIFISSSQLSSYNDTKFEWYISNKQKAPNVLGYTTTADFPEATIEKLDIEGWTNQYDVWGSIKVKATTTYVPMISKKNFNESIKFRKIIASLANYIYTYMKVVWSDADDGFVIEISDMAPLQDLINPIFKQSEPIYDLNIKTEDFLRDILKSMILPNSSTIFYLESNEMDAIIEKEVQTRIGTFSEFIYAIRMDLPENNKELYIFNHKYERLSYRNELDETYASNANTFHIVKKQEVKSKTKVLLDTIVGNQPKNEITNDTIIHTSEKSLDQLLASLYQPENKFDFNQKYYLGKSSLFTLIFDSDTFEYSQFKFNKED